MSEAPLTLAEATAQLTAPGQMFETARDSVLGVEMTVWKNAPANLRQILDLSLRHADRDFLVYEDKRLTFEEHYRTAATFAARLVEVGVVKGDRVAIAARNLPQWISTFWGTVITGAVVVPLNAWWSSEELHYGLSDSGSSVLVLDQERLERVRPLLHELNSLTTVVVIGETSPEEEIDEFVHGVRVVNHEKFLGRVERIPNPPDIEIDADDDATMFYSSGTTGHPKGAVGTHRNVISNLMNLFFIGQRAALRFPSSASNESDDSASLLNVPLFHATGCLAVMVVNVAAGAKIILMHHFDPAKALALIESERLTSIGGVPTVVMQLLDHPDFERYDTSSIRSVSYGGAPAPPQLVKRIHVAFPHAQPGNGYGLTETSAAIALNSGTDYVDRPESCGTPVPVCEVAIMPEGFAGDEPTPDLPRGPEVLGELWVKGPNVVRGYWNRPRETSQSFTNGWLHTGDIARMDGEGFLYIVDRSKDMIIRGGENIYSIVVESALFDHPDVADCAVVGLAHPTLGEEVAAVIVLRPWRRIDAEELARHVAHRLAHFEVPTRFFFRAVELPRNPQGKVLKRELRASLLEEMQRSG